jgi:hypothetical protein
MHTPCVAHWFSPVCHDLLQVSSRQQTGTGDYHSGRRSVGALSEPAKVVEALCNFDRNALAPVQRTTDQTAWEDMQGSTSTSYLFLPSQCNLAPSVLAMMDIRTCFQVVLDMGSNI